LNTAVLGTSSLPPSLSPSFTNPSCFPLPPIPRSSFTTLPPLPALPRTAVSTDSKYSHFAWATQDRKEGGLGPNLELPLIADRNMQISRDYGVLLEDEGIALRGLFIVDPKGILRCVFLEFFQTWGRGGVRGLGGEGEGGRGRGGGGRYGERMDE